DDVLPSVLLGERLLLTDERRPGGGELVAVLEAELVEGRELLERTELGVVPDAGLERLHGGVPVRGAGLRIDLPHPRHLAVLPFELALDGEREDVDRSEQRRVGKYG